MTSAEPPREWICGGCAAGHPTEAAMDECAARDLDVLVAAARAYVRRAGLAASKITAPGPAY